MIVSSVQHSAAAKRRDLASPARPAACVAKDGADRHCPYRILAHPLCQLLQKVVGRFTCRPSLACRCRSGVWAAGRSVLAVGSKCWSGSSEIVGHGLTSFAYQRTQADPVMGCRPTDVSSKPSEPPHQRHHDGGAHQPLTPERDARMAPAKGATEAAAPEGHQRPVISRGLSSRRTISCSTMAPAVATFSEFAIPSIGMATAWSA